MHVNYPTDILIYFRSLPNKFGVKSKTPLKVVYLITSIICLILIVKPTLISNNSLITRIIAAIVFIIVGLLSLYGQKIYYNKKSGGILSGPIIRKFDTSTYSEHDIINMFNENDFKGLFKIPTSQDKNTLQLSIFEDREGEEFYCQLRKYFPSSDFKGISYVITIREPQYSMMRKLV